MALQAGGQAPYTTSQAAVTVVDWFRDRAPSGPITPEAITRAGVPESLANRTFNSLRMLDLLDKDGSPTEQFQDFQRIRGEDEYRTRLQEWLRGVYGEVLQYCDPSQDSYERVVEAFRGYQPQGQRRAMAGLLLGLWRYAGLPVASAPKAPTGASSQRPRPQLRAPKAKPTAPINTASRVEGAYPLQGGGLPAGLLGLLHQIPQDGNGWSKATRDNFLAAFTAVLDFSVPIVEPSTAPEPEDDTEED
jgi:hypothetical protein